MEEQEEEVEKKEEEEEEGEDCSRGSSAGGRARRKCFHLCVLTSGETIRTPGGGLRGGNTVRMELADTGVSQRVPLKLEVSLTKARRRAACCCSLPRSEADVTAV